MIKRFAMTAVFVLSTSFATAQDAPPATDDELELARSIKSQATEFVATIGALSAQLTSLPDNLAGMETLYDEMIAEVDSMLEMASPESDLANGVVTLRTAAENARAEWQQRCDASNSSRDCERVAMWDQRVAKAIEQQDTFGGIVEQMQAARRVIDENRLYGIDDLRLREFDRAQDGLDASLDQMNAIAASMTALATAVGGPEFEGQETN